MSIICDSVIVTVVIFSFVFGVNAGSEASESLTVEIEIKKSFKQLAFSSSVKGHVHIKLEVQKVKFLGLISSQNKIYCSKLYLHSKHMVVFYKQ